MKNKRGNLFFLVLFLIIIFGLAFIGWNFISNLQGEKYSFFVEKVCGDRTSYGECATIKPYYCEQGKLVENAFYCGCPESGTQKGELCVYKYQEDSKELTLNYILDGKKEEINFTVYNSLNEYLSNLESSFITEVGTNPTIADFKWRNLDNPYQKDLLNGLIIAIQNKADNSLDQARIAISLVQGLDYGSSEKNVTLQYGVQLTDTRYPYETLSSKQGLCGEKSELLSFLLKGLGYDVILFRYFTENHEVVGIRCPIENSLYGSGYCFIEATRPSIITDNSGEYFGIGKLLSKPSIIEINESHLILGLPEGLEEYKDSIKWQKLYSDVSHSGGKISNRDYNELNRLMIKYGLSLPKNLQEAIDENLK